MSANQNGDECFNEGINAPSDFVSITNADNEQAFNQLDDLITTTREKL